MMSYACHSEEAQRLSQELQGNIVGPNDPLIQRIPNVYAPSGIDVLNILLEIKCRPNPVIDIGNVDSGVALVLCDADAPDHPILYCSEPFMELTGYNSSEILGRNCRFLQHPPGGNRQCADRRINAINAIARREVKQTVSRGRETQTKFINYCKDGSAFVNILTLIPIRWMGRNYIVGFQADERILGR